MFYFSLGLNGLKDTVEKKSKMEIFKLNTILNILKGFLAEFNFLIKAHYMKTKFF